MFQSLKLAQAGSLIDSLDAIALETGKSGRKDTTDTPNVGKWTKDALESQFTFCSYKRGLGPIQTSRYRPAELNWSILSSTLARR